ncbi:OCIA domain-containing protein 1 [Fasciola gigantica]|uniref:OCIA domain-containing protein 1 n=1 Tax=Fasciola gigantica TaxID=46835 RepID=A0A504YZW5_FASGI|nr:OCIA domain-containing protein 1 [Fasciola gigantica]
MILYRALMSFFDPLMNRHGPDVQLTDEDVATIRKCRQLSFWRGSVPFTIGSCMAVAVAQNFGFFNSRPRLRAPMYVLATVFGYLGGKFSYLGACKSMFLELDDSRIKDYILEGKEMPSLQTGPLIVNTPVISDIPEVSRPMTYAERREYYRNQPSDSQLSPDPQPLPIPETTERTPRSSSSFFNDDRPSGSYQFDDVYRPREE